VAGITYQPLRALIRNFCRNQHDYRTWDIKSIKNPISTLVQNLFTHRNQLLQKYLSSVSCIFLEIKLRVYFMWQESVAELDTATCHGLDGPRIESPWRRNFPQPSRVDLKPTQPSIQWVPDYFPGVKRHKRGVDHSPHLAPRLKKE